MTDKKALRKHFKEIRLSMSAEERKQADVAVQQAFLDSEEYKSCTTVLAYVSSDIEVSTAEIVRKALKSKIVLCPRCEKNGNIMYFHRINSTYDLKEGRFGIFEPDESCEKYCVLTMHCVSCLRFRMIKTDTGLALVWAFMTDFWLIIMA